MADSTFSPSLKGILSLYFRFGMLPIVLTIMAAGISLTFPLFPKWAVDLVVLQGDWTRLGSITLSFFGVLLIYYLFEYYGGIRFFKFQRDVVLLIQDHLIARLFSYPLDFFDNSHSGYLVGRIRNDSAGLYQLFSSLLIHSFLDCLKVLFVMVILFNMNTKLTLVAMIIIPLILLVIARFNGRIKKENSAFLEENAQVEKHLSDVFQGMEVFKSQGYDSTGYERASLALKKFQKVEINRNKILEKYRIGLNLSAGCGEVLILFFGIKEIQLGRLTVGGFIAFSGYLMMLYNPFKNFSNTLVFFDYARRSFLRIKDLLNLIPECKGDQVVDEVRQIVVTNLSFQFNDDIPLFQDLSLELNKGDRLLLLGPSGSGKSTLVKVLLGLLKPTQGEIRINGIGIDRIELEIFRRRIGYVSQNIFLFNQPLRENLLLCHKGITDAELLNILDECHFSWEGRPLEASLLDRMVGEKGCNFSAGEKQRIALARTLIKQPDLIIMDEATANLDTETAQLLEEMIRTRFATRMIIKISHREQDYTGWKIIRLNQYKPQENKSS